MNSPAQALGLRNTFTRLTRDKKLKVIVIGNSVTHGAPAGEKKNPSFYVALDDWLHAKFPDAQIEVIPKIIFAMGPEVQLFRMDERMYAERPDLVLVEFNAANGAANNGWGQNGPPLTEAATEGYIRRLRLLLPDTDCVMQMAIYEAMMKDYSAGRPPLSSSFHHQLAPYYNCVYADAAQEVASRLIAGDEWKTYMDDGIHPSVKGYEVYGQVLLGEMEKQWQLFQQLPEAERTIRSHAFPEKSLTPEPWLFPRLVSAPFFAKFDDGFTIRECGTVKYIVADRAGASGRFQAVSPGKIVGVLFRNSKPCGNLEILSNGQWVKLLHDEPRFTEANDPANIFYRRFFRPNDLPPEMDSIEFRVSADPQKPGEHHVEIVGFFVLERPAAIPFHRA